MHRACTIVCATTLALLCAHVAHGATLQAKTPGWPTARALIDESNAARTAGDYATAAAKVAEAVTELLARPEPEQDREWLSLLHSAGAAASRARDDQTANRAWRREYEVRLATHSDDDVALQAARGNLALSLQNLGDHAAAEVLLEKVLEVYSRTLPDDNYNLQAARVNLAMLLAQRGELSRALELLQQVLDVFTRTLPDDHPALQGIRGNVANALRQSGDLAGARQLEEKVLAGFSRTLPDHHPDLQSARLNLAATLKELGRLDEARALQAKVLEVYSQTLPDDHVDLQKARGNLAGTLRSLGDLSGARTLFERALAGYSRGLPDENPDVQIARQNLAVVLSDLGDLSGARVVYERVLDVLSRTVADDQREVQVVRQNLAAVLAELGDHVGARALEEQVLEVYSRTLPPDHPDLLKAQGALAGTLRVLDDVENAKSLEERVLEAFARVRADDHPDLQVARLNLSTTLNHMGDHAGARALMERVLEIDSSLLPDEHPRLQGVRANLALTIAAEAARVRRAGEGPHEDESRTRCMELVRAFARAQTSAARAAVLTGSGREAQERCSSLEKRLDVLVSIAQGYGVFGPDLELTRAAFALSETARGAALASAWFERRAAASPRYAQLRATLVTASNDLARLARGGAASEDLDRARSRRESVERELMQLGHELSGAEDSVLEIDAERLAATLGAGEAAVSFRRYTKLELVRVEERDSGDRPTSRERRVESLCAFVVRAATTPPERAATLRLVDLGPIGPIEDSVHAWRSGIGVSRDGRGVGTTGREPALASMLAHGLELRTKLLDPLLPVLADTRHLVVALDDVLHLVPLEALALDDTTLVGDRWQVETRATLSERIRSAQSIEGPSTLVVFGDVDFESAGERPAESVHPNVGERASILRGGSWERGFSALPGSGVEVRGIEDCFANEFGREASRELCERASATRERLVELAPKARYLHIATHGWFAPESLRSWRDPAPVERPTGLATRMSEAERLEGMSPMLLCGLAFAGANLPEDAAGRAPGLITADELSTLDLSNCELAVLSACDTSVGERRAGQGVASLQTALQMAGARSVITSLWRVPDEATKELMLDFYRRLWVEKKPKWQALWEAKTMMRHAKDERGAPKYSTRDWAAWVLSGEPD